MSASHHRWTLQPVLFHPVWREEFPPRSQRNEWQSDYAASVVASGHLFQILLNLILNANDAISPQGGSITVRTGMDADGVFVQVIDDGRGMDAATLRHILEPFYTTKTGGKGLGLSVVNDIVRRYEGSIEIDSDVGNGSRFTVAFRTAG